MRPIVVGIRCDVVGLTVAEFTPQRVMHLRQILTDFPLLGTCWAKRDGSSPRQRWSFRLGIPIPWC